MVFTPSVKNMSSMQTQVGPGDHAAGDEYDREGGQVHLVPEEEESVGEKPWWSSFIDTEGVTAEYVSREVMLGITVCFAQIPESVAFAFMANVKPPIALHAAWIVGFIVSAFGGRPGMVNGATGAFAAIIGTFIDSAGTGENGEGVERLFPSVFLAGVLMLVVSALRLSRFITLLPLPVMVGFCNGLAIVIGLAQLHPFKDKDTHHWKTGAELFWMLAICFSAMATMEFLPWLQVGPCKKILKIVPSSLMAIVVAVLMEFCIVRPSGSRTDTIRDVSEFTSDTRFPIPFFVETDAVSYDLKKIYEDDGISQVIIQGILLCTVGTIESLMTSEVVQSFVKTPSNHDRTVFAMGVGNIISGLLGGMGGNAMIGLSTINALNGGTGRLGPCVAAFGIAICCMGAYPALNFIPMAALAGIMIVVVLHTFKWFSISMLLAACMPASFRAQFELQRKVPRIEIAVIVIVTVLAVLTNIAYAVGIGVAICSMAFAWISGRQLDVTITEEENVKRYHVAGPLFFVTANKFKRMMNPENDPDDVEVWFGQSKLMDYSAMAVLHDLSLSYEAVGKKLKFHAIHPDSAKLLVKANHLVKQVEYELRCDDIIEDVPVPSIRTEFSKDPGTLSRAMHIRSDQFEASCQTSTGTEQFAAKHHGEHHHGEARGWLHSHLPMHSVGSGGRKERKHAAVGEHQEHTMTQEPQHHAAVLGKEEEHARGPAAEPAADAGTQDSHHHDHVQHPHDAAASAKEDEASGNPERRPSDVVLEATAVHAAAAEEEPKVVVTNSPGSHGGSAPTNLPQDDSSEAGHGHGSNSVANGSDEVQALSVASSAAAAAAAATALARTGDANAPARSASVRTCGCFPSMSPTPPRQGSCWVCMRQTGDLRNHQCHGRVVGLAPVRALQGPAPQVIPPNHGAVTEEVD